MRLPIAIAALALTAVGTAASAGTVTLSDTQEILLQGEDLTFSFGPLAASDGNGGTITIVGDGDNNLASPGPDLAADFENDTVEISFDGDSQGVYSCDGNNGSIAFDTAVITESPILGLDIGCTFTQTFALSGTDLDALIGDGSLDVLFATSDDVQFRANSPVTVTLSYEMAVIPLPATLPLGLAGLGLLYGFTRRRRA